VVYIIQSLKHGKETIRIISARPATRKERKAYADNKLNLSDIPEATDEQLRRARRVGRPATGNAKQLIAIRIAPRLLAQLRRLAARRSPYQTLIHELLERAAAEEVA
jgi:predicted DNA binding CopG/RHH family protein